jgi:alpha-1,6-mannosyltransferase
LKLLDITEFYSPQGGGVRTYLTEKARWLAARDDVEHTVIVPAAQDGATQWERSRVHFVRGPRVPASPGYHFLVAGRKVARLVRAAWPDVIEVGSPYLAPWIARRAARGTAARLAAYVHENPRFYVASAPHPVRAIADPVLVRYLAAAHRSFDLAIAASGANLAGIGVASGAVVPLGVDPAMFDPARRDPAWRAEVGAAPGQVVALYAGRLSVEKGLDVVLGALPALHRATGLVLVCQGAGHMRPRLERAARAHPAMLRVLPFEPDRPRVARAYASADFCFAPCPFETFGLAALEAMASGLPIVGVSAGGIGRLLTGADWARTYRAGEEGDCERATRALLATDLRQAGARARAAVLERYSWDRTFTELLALYRRLAVQRASDPRARSAAPSAAPSISV